MLKKKGRINKTNIYNKLHILLFIITIIIMLSFTLAPAGNSIPIRNSTVNSLKSGQGIESLRSNLDSATVNFMPSLEMKENVDFLLTPVFLVQEAISDDIIITYPSE